MKIIIVAIGTQGDVNPLVSIGAELKKRGHDVTVLASSFFEDIIKDACLQLHSTCSAGEFKKATKFINIQKLNNNIPAMLENLFFPPIKKVYKYICEHYIPNQTVVLAGALPFGAWLAQEKIGVPMVMLHSSPYKLRSSYNVPKGYRMLSNRAPKWYKDMYWKIFDSNYDKLIFPTLNKFRKEIGLESEKPRYLLHRRDNSTKIIGLFPDWFAEHQKDWPEQTELTGFPFFDEESARSDNYKDLEAFLNDGEKPIVFTPGTGVRSAEFFFKTSIEACQILKKRAIFLTRFREQIPKKLPSSICYFDYIPLNILLPRSEALVSHGGIGTCAQALKAGIPHLVIPHGFDQFDNSSRLQELGVSDEIRIKNYRSDKIVIKLRKLIESRSIQNRCQELANKIKHSNVIEDTCKILEAL